MQRAENSTLPVEVALRKESSHSGQEPVRSPMAPLPEETTIHEALVLMDDQGIVAAPVLDEAGQPVGVLSRTGLGELRAEHLESLMVERAYEVALGRSASWPSHRAVEREVHRIARGESDPNRFRR